MGLVHEIRGARGAAIWAPVLGLCALAYFAYHGVYGDRGFISYTSLQVALADARAAQTVGGAERGRLEQRVSLLRARHLDPDMLEERARVVLNYVRDDEVVILLDD